MSSRSLLLPQVADSIAITKQRGEPVSRFRVALGQRGEVGVAVQRLAQQQTAALLEQFDRLGDRPGVHAAVGRMAANVLCVFHIMLAGSVYHASLAQYCQS